MALNPDAIPTSEQVRETLLDRLYYPYQKQIWLGITVLSVAIVGFLALREFRARRAEEQWARYSVALEAGRSTASPGDPASERAGAEERIAALKRVVDDYPGEPVAAFALNAKMAAEIDAKRYDDALQSLSELRQRFPDFPVNTESIDTASGGVRRSIADRIEAMIRAEKDWATESQYSHPAPTSKFLALIETNLGNLWLGFYDQQAPRHVENFVALAKSGYFNGTQFYHVRSTVGSDNPAPLDCEGGSAASRFDAPASNRDPATHDADDPTALLEPEEAQSLIRHRRGVVSSVVQGSGESARRFLIVAAANGLRQYDRQNTPFAMVLDREGSLAVLDRICLASTYRTHPDTKDDPEHARMRDHPYPPIWIRRVSIWADEALQSGHSWDTTVAGTETPGPWEASFVPPKPSEFSPKEVAPVPSPEDPKAPRKEGEGEKSGDGPSGERKEEPPPPK